MKISNLLIVFLISCSSLLANPLDYDNSENMEVQQKAISSMKALREFRADIEKGFNLGKPTLAMVIGTSYMKNYNFKDGQEKANLFKATAWFKKGVDKNDIPSAIMYSKMMALKQNYNELISSLYKALYNSSPTDKLYQQGLEYYAANVLDKSITDSFEVERAVELISKTERYISPNLRFMYANLLQAINQKDLANINLTAACSDNRLSMKAKRICRNFDTRIPKNEKPCSDYR